MSFQQGSYCDELLVVDVDVVADMHNDELLVVDVDVVADMHNDEFLN
jgi:hypothetical protein